MLVSADDHLVVRLVQDLLPEHRRPEPSDGSRIARVNDQLIETDGHTAMLSCRSELDLVREALDAFALRGEVLELAGGTGLCNPPIICWASLFLLDRGLIPPSLLTFLAFDL